MNKSGQIALFVIIAVLVIGAVSVFILFQTNVIKAPVSAEQAQKIVAAQVQPIRDHVEGCMIATIMPSINTMGRQGGHIIPVANRVSIPAEVMADAPAMPYALFYDKDSGYENLLPSIEEMETELQYFLQLNPSFDTCINNFKTFRSVDVSAGTMVMEKPVMNDMITIRFTYPATISRGDAKTILDETYTVIVPINMQKIRETSGRIINGVIEGKADGEIKKENAEILEKDLRQSQTSETMLINSLAFNEVPTDLSGKNYNNLNTLYTLQYNSINLDEPFYFNFLIGQP